MSFDGAGDVFDGPITVSHDGTMVSLLSGSDVVHYDNQL